MTLEFEKLTAEVVKMAQEMHRQRGLQQVKVQEALRLLDEYAVAWDTLATRVEQAQRQTDEKFYRAALPLHTDHPLNKGIAPGPAPKQATIIASDGSQIVPDRHAAFLYYLINIGTITYYHGRALAPAVETNPRLVYPGSDVLNAEEDDAFTISSAIVGMRRDQLEIETLAAKTAQAFGQPGPRLAILDQRLLYFPVGNLPGPERQNVVEKWQEAITAVRLSGGWLAGFIDRPGKKSVLSMLYSMQVDQPGFKASDIYRTDLLAGLTDTHLFDTVLLPSERSTVFVDVSDHNNKFANKDAENEVCFFYLKTGPGEQQLARVDIPRSVAEDHTAVAAIHALLVEQCRILGSYPYTITRADEIAVVGRFDQDELENRISLRLAEYDLRPGATSKQMAKNLARTSKTRYKD
jgi:hypothetical protein